MTDGSEKIRNTVTRYVHQEPMSYCTEKAKVVYLYNSGIGRPSAKPILARCYADLPPWHCQQFYIAIITAWLQEQMHGGKNQAATKNTNVFW